MNWFDAHCHLTDDRLWQNLESVMAECEVVGVTHWVLAGYSPADWSRQKDLAARFPGRVVQSYGLHPWWVHAQNPDSFALGLEQLKLQAVTAQIVGETGLDFYGNRRQSELLQRQALESQVRLAKQLGKPLALHIVRAHPEAVEALKPFAPLSGWVHSYSGSAEQVRSYLDLGLCISLGGSALGLSGEKGPKLLAAIPEERLLLETDAPDQKPRLAELAPEPWNHPRNLVRIAEKISEFSGKDPTRLLNNSRKNIERVLGWKAG